MNNEPAYPSRPYLHERVGLTKRELIAAMAMQGLIARYGTENNHTVCDAVSYADALLEALK